MTTEAERIAAGLTEAQRRAVLDGRVTDCPYNHPIGTRCPNCSGWPFKKGGAANFVASMRTHLTSTGGKDAEVPHE